MGIPSRETEQDLTWERAGRRTQDMEKMPPLTGRSARPSPNRQVRGTGVEGDGEAEGRDDGRTVAGESLYSQLWPHGGVYILRWISGHKTAPFSP